MNRQHVVQVITRCMAGAGLVAVEGALGLDPERYRGTIVAGSGDRLLERAAHAGLDVLLVPDLVSPLDPMRDRRALAALTARLTLLAPDVVHTHSAKAGALGRLAARRAAVPWVVHTYHGFPFHPYMAAWRRNGYIAIERRLGRITDRGLAVGAGVAAEAVQRGMIAPQRLRTIDPVADVPDAPATAAERAAARALIGLPPAAPVMGSVGRLDFQKDPQCFVRALARLNPQTQGVWVGGGPLRADVESLARRLGVGDRLHLLGDRADVNALLPALDVFAMPSRYEGLPCALVEAIRRGIPVVAAAVNAVPDVVQPGRTGLLIAPQEPGQLADAVAGLLAEPGWAAELARNARALVAGRFDGSGLARILDEVYRPREVRHLAAA